VNVCVCVCVCACARAHARARIMYCVREFILLYLQCKYQYRIFLGIYSVRIILILHQYHYGILDLAQTLLIPVYLYAISENYDVIIILCTLVLW